MTATVTAPAPNPVRRLISLDALRGITIAFMIMVNDNGDDRTAWPFMKHADWNGMTATDLVFPTFLFVVGASIVFAFEARLAKGATRTQLAWQTLRRAAILFLFGTIINGYAEVLFHFPHIPWGTWRIYGVLQRIAICYLIASLLYLWNSKPANKIAIIVGALVGYWILMRWVPVPGLGLPGRDIPFLDRDANLVAWIDRHVFPHRLYEITRDPEGLLSTLPAMGTCLLGMLAGMWMRTKHTLTGKAAGLAGAAAGLIALGSLWAIWFPLNKKLWTSSYVLVAAGISTAALALLFWVIEVKDWRGKWIWPWIVLGSNAIAVYMISELLGTTINAVAGWIHGKPFDATGWVDTHWFLPIGHGGLGSFAYSFAYLVVCFIPIWILYRKRIFLKV
ncbi:acyltransferase family protein [Acidicapsa ligni]|uniref:acyltransferase family protein n=1 Tax=Acidicapsa ligni TaxID=542300 RepID=UPI0021DF9042|nr:heparan-alpha-glucosaminide N-acetyltransferase domain-containing protein [Acidicapsa ligni]